MSSIHSLKKENLNRMAKTAEDKIVTINSIPKKDLLEDTQEVLISEEEHALEEKRLNSMIETYFMANPANQLYEALEEDEEDEETPTAENNETEKTAHKNEPQYNFVEKSIIRGVVLGLVEELGREQKKVRTALTHCGAGENLPGTSPIDNLYDAYRKERNHLTSIIGFDDKVLLEKAPKHIQERVERRTQTVFSDLSRELVSGDLLEKYYEQQETLKEMQNAMHILMNRVNDLEFALYQEN